MPDADDPITALIRRLAPEVGPREDAIHRVRDELHRRVAEHVARLLDRSPELLLSILYRIDVAEHRVREAFATEPPDALPGRLADLIIERHLRKIETRRRYGGAGDPRPPQSN